MYTGLRIYSEDVILMSVNLTPEERQRRVEHGYEIQKLGSAAPWTEERKEKARKTREKTRNFNLLARYMMEAEIPDEDEALEELRFHGFENADYQTAVFWGQLKKAIYGLDTEAAKYVRDTAGYKPREGLDIGNLDDKPFTSIDLSKLSNEELLAMIAKRETIEE